MGLFGTRNPKTLLAFTQNSEVSCYPIKMYILNDKPLDRFSDFSDMNKMKLKHTHKSSREDWRRVLEFATPRDNSWIHQGTLTSSFLSP